MSTDENTRLFSKRQLGRLSVAILFISVVLWMLDYEDKSGHQTQAAQPILKVSSIRAVPEDHRPTVTVVGITASRWPVDIVATVSGRVVEFPPLLEPGKLLTKDELLLGIDDVPYQSDLAAKASRVKQAELEVARIRHEKTVTEQVSGSKKLSSFGRFEPHLAAAEAELSAAIKSLAESQKNLSETRQFAPFDAILLNKWVVPGQWINAGDRLFQLAANDSMDVHIELSAQQLSRLGNLENQPMFQVSDQNGRQWPARLRYREPVVSAQTRQAKIVLSVTAPYAAATKLYPQSMVVTKVTGPVMPNVVSMPSSVLTNDGNVWAINDGTLQETEIVIIEAIEDTVLFQFIESPSASRELVRFPLSSMLSGQKVQPVNAISEPGSLKTENTGAAK